MSEVLAMITVSCTYINLYLHIYSCHDMALFQTGAKTLSQRENQSIVLYGFGHDIGMPHWEWMCWHTRG